MLMGIMKRYIAILSVIIWWKKITIIMAKTSKNRDGNDNHNNNSNNDNNSNNNVNNNKWKQK